MRKRMVGFTFIEVLMSMTLMAVLSAVSISVVQKSFEESKYSGTSAQMINVRNALVGDPELKEGGVRSSYGYLGDVGSIPSSIQGLKALLVKPSGVASFTIDSTKRISLGWNGPYLIAELGTNPLLDGWGRVLIYTMAVLQNGSSSASITSYGADGVAGGTGYNQDIKIDIPAEMVQGSVHGYLSNAGAPISTTATVELYYANGAGSLATATKNLTVSDAGYFQFTNIPLGKHSVSFFVPNKTNPTFQKGPVFFDSNGLNSLAPTNLLDIDPTGTAGSGSNPTSEFSCASPAGVISLSSVMGVDFVSGEIRFVANVSSNVQIQSIATETSEAIPLSKFSMNITQTWGCGAGRSLSPCPGVDKKLSTLQPTVNVNGGGGGGGDRSANPQSLVIFGVGIDSTKSTSRRVRVLLKFGASGSQCDILDLTSF